MNAQLFGIHDMDVMSIASTATLIIALSRFATVEAFHAWLEIRKEYRHARRNNKA